MRIILSAGFVLLVATSAAAAESADPSFDCHKASTPVEKAICADPKLAALDRKVAQNYGEALQRLEGTGATALRQDQRSFQAVLSYGMETNRGQPKNKPIFDLGDTLAGRADFLAAIRPAPADRWAGTWSNRFGGVEIKEAGGHLHVSIDGAMPVTGNWVCGIEGRAKVEQDALVVLDDGWTYRLAREGGRLSVSQHGPKGESYGSPSCGHNGSMEGDYFFLAKPAAPDTTAHPPSR